jgi:GT2 family glycosyltransferase
VVRHFPKVRVLHNRENLGFGAGVNRGVSEATGDWVALLNNDAIADPEWLTRMLEVADFAAGVGMVACKIYLDRGRRMLDKVGHKIALDGQNFGRGHGALDVGQYDALTEVAWPDGCAALFRRSLFEQVGGVDEEFFAYADDADLGIRVRIAGYRCALAPLAIVEHRHSQSLGAYSAKKLYLVERNRIWLSAKYFPWPLLAVNPLLWLCRAALTLSADRRGEGPFSRVDSSHRMGVATAILRAQVDGWRGLPRQLRKRAQLGQTCGRAWQTRMHALLAEERASLGSVARGDVR